MNATRHLKGHPLDNGEDVTQDDMGFEKTNESTRDPKNLMQVTYTTV